MPDFDTSVPHIARVYDYWLGGDIDADQQTEMVRRLNQSVAEKATMRDRAGVTRLFDGLELLEPGVVRVSGWRPDSDLEAARPTGLWGGVACKP